MINVLVLECRPIVLRPILNVILLECRPIVDVVLCYCKCSVRVSSL